MTELFDEITRTVSAMNESYMTGYRDAKLELRRRLRAAIGGAPVTIESAHTALAVVTEFIDV